MQFIETAYASEGEREAETDTGVLGSLGINSTLFISQLVNFGIVVVVLWFLILKPLSKKLTERQKMIDEAIENSRLVQDNLLKSEQKFEDMIASAKVEANKIAEKADVDAEKRAEEMKIKAKRDIDGLIEQAKKNIKTERDEMKAEIKQETAEMIMLALQKILSEKITDKKDKELIAEMVKKIK